MKLIFSLIKIWLYKIFIIRYSYSISKFANIKIEWSLSRFKLLLINRLINK